jgi:hypothetical protein
MVGVRARSLASDFDRWWMMGTPRARAVRSKIAVSSLVYDAAASTPTLVRWSPQVRIACEYTSLDSSIDTIGITAHGIDIFPQLPGIFYNAYMPSRYAENSMVSAPADSSTFLINFCLYPGKFSPSGYYNLSAGREIYINYVLQPAAGSALLTNPQEMVISMSAINFLMRRGDKISLRYAL